MLKLPINYDCHELFINVPMYNTKQTLQFNKHDFKTSLYHSSVISYPFIYNHLLKICLLIKFVKWNVYIFQTRQYMQEYIKPGLTMIDIWYVNLLLIFKEYQWLVASQWFSLVSSINKTDRHDITEILLKVALNT
jgi:hypothetical protein